MNRRTAIAELDARLTLLQELAETQRALRKSRALCRGLRNSLRHWRQAGRATQDDTGNLRAGIDELLAWVVDRNKPGDGPELPLSWRVTWENGLRRLVLAIEEGDARHG